jgi:hypothetical protein
VADFSGERRIEVSAGATTLIAQILDAIMSDPHPSWQYMDHSHREQVVGSFFEILPSFLDVIAFSQSNPRDYHVITTFAVLHWLTDNLDSICPIPKG